jgi:hypothetical protein
VNLLNFSPLEIEATEFDEDWPGIRMGRIVGRACCYLTHTLETVAEFLLGVECRGKIGDKRRAERV